MNNDEGNEGPPLVDVAPNEDVTQPDPVQTSVSDDDEFELARAEYRARCEKTSLNKIALDVSRSTRERLAAPESKHPSSSFSRSTKALVIDFAKRQKAVSMYDLLAQQMEQGRASRAFILDEFIGFYRYFRHAAIGDAAEIRYVVGWLEIFENERGEPAFRHWAHGHKTTDKPEHSGLVFHHGDCLHMLGWRHGVIRLSIAHLSEDELVEGRFFNGVVASVRTRPRTPFAAGFLMVSAKNQTLVDRLLPKTQNSRQLFLRLSFGEAWFLLAAPKIQSGGG